MSDTGNNSPRVSNKATRVTDAASPRVNEVQSRYSIGTKISKAFDGVEYSRKIIRDNGRYYRVEYEDGDEEDMTHTKIKKHLPKIPYTGGYANALQAILKNNYNVTKIALDNLRECKNFANAVTHPVTGKQMEYQDLIKDPEYKPHWTISKANELGRLAQGVGKTKNGEQRVKGMDACDFIFKHEVEKGKTVTYARTVCTVRPKKRRTKSNKNNNRRKSTRLFRRKIYLHCRFRIY